MRIVNASAPASATERPLTIIAQDPSVETSSDHILTTQVMVPAERLAPGPWGYRIQVIDYDATSNLLYSPWRSEPSGRGDYVDHFAGESRTSELLGNPAFHAQQVYAVAMRVLARFEFALGRRVEWSFASHQLKIAPHAFQDANAYYAREHEALEFGYFAGNGGNVFTCLSHDIVAHETTHAVLDGLHSRFIEPSNLDQAAFHEALADMVALLSVFSLPDVVMVLLSGENDGAIGKPPVINSKKVSADALRRSMLLGLAEQMGAELNAARGRPLRQSLLLEPTQELLTQPRYQECHSRGEILVAAVLNALVSVLEHRLKSLDPTGAGVLDLGRVVEEAAEAADHLLTIVIRALDYCPPMHLTFSDYLSALLTSDAELVGDDTKYGYREQLRLSFADFGIPPASGQTEGEHGLWEPCRLRFDTINYSRAHFRSMQYDSQEVFRFLWENRQHFKLRDDVYTRVLAVRPCVRISPEGFPLHETIVHYLQYADIRADELKRFGLRRPETSGESMQASTRIQLQGGGTLVFDQHGRVKYDIGARIDSEKQNERIEELWRSGHFREGYRPASGRDFRRLHQLRSLAGGGDDMNAREAWC